MNSRFLWAAIFLTATTFLFADPRSVVGLKAGPVVMVISGTGGSVRLFHEGTLVREVPTPWKFTAAVVLASPLDKVEWDGSAPTSVAVGKDSSATARHSLEDRSAPHLFFIKSDGSVEVEKVPKKGEDDAETAATAEE